MEHKTIKTKQNTKPSDGDFYEGEKVTVVGDTRRYDFGYLSGTGMAVLYYEGERNMQDSFAVDVGLVRRLKR